MSSKCPGGLTAGHELYGMFNFFENYEWKCESYRKPLENLQPPYMFTIETFHYCPSQYCFSKIFP